MRNHLHLIYASVDLEKLPTECRFSTNLPLCALKVANSLQHIEKTKFNGSYDADDLIDYYENDYFLPPSSTETFIHYFYLIVFPYFLLSGTIGNILSVTLMRRYSHNVWSTCMYMAIVLPMDLIKLYVECGNDWLTEVQNWSLSQQILLLSNAVCKVYNFTYSLLLQECEWIMVAVAIETAIAVKRPLLIYKMCTTERAHAVVLFISVILISLNLHFFWTHGLVVPSDDPFINSYFCTYVSELSNKFRDYIWPVISFSTEDLGPFLIITGSVIYSLSGMVPSFGAEKQHDTHLEKYFLDVKALHQIRKAMIAVCFVSCLSILCGIIQIGLIYFTNKLLIDIDYEGQFMATTVLSVLSYLFMSHKFWIFYVFCEKFRSDVKTILRSMCRPCKSRRKTTRRYSLRDTKQDATASWQETETCLSRNV